MSRKNRKLLMALPMTLIAGLGGIVMGMEQVASGTAPRASSPSEQARSAKELEQVALQRIAIRHRLTIGQLKVVSSATARYPELGTSVQEFKVVDQKTYKVYGLALDMAGREQDPSRLQALELEAYDARYGRFDPSLAEKVLETPDNELLEVAIWLKEPGVQAPPRPRPGRNVTQDQVDALMQQVADRRAEAVEAVAGPVLERLQARGFDASADALAPVIFAHLPVAALLEIELWDEVERIYEPQLNAPSLEMLRATIHADVVNGRGITGSGVKVAEIEV